MSLCWDYKKYWGRWIRRNNLLDPPHPQPLSHKGERSLMLANLFPCGRGLGRRGFKPPKKYLCTRINNLFLFPRHAIDAKNIPSSFSIEFKRQAKNLNAYFAWNIFIYQFLFCAPKNAHEELNAIFICISAHKN